ncbi:hypothetical protein BDV98DRAFT_593521 [Pterulicium gracile]|uniref:FAD/NAD(P)-binding domain-containing protein n=1 Tax=Pterulicium gracile TaxID=1884261 RepID=A0A5C3QG99_9AGAR|nr:hypothetical protein BDV98DRAFT_593521 [Pterula gracilis]
MSSWELIAFATVACAIALHLNVRLQTTQFWVHKELDTLGNNSGHAARRGKAVICGSGIAGLMAARECMDHFEQVVLVDPEFSKTLDGASKSRSMQYHSSHLYSIPFAEGLRRLWPCFDQRADEVEQAEYNGETNLHIDGTCIRSPARDKPSSFGMRRSTLEPLLHRLLMEGTPEAKNRLTIIDGTVRKLANASHVGRGDTIASVEGRYIHGGKDFQIDDIDLLIGRAQCGVKWLEEAGFTPPQRVSYSPHLRYTTITFTGISEEVYTSLPIPAERRGGALVFYPDPNISRSGIVFSKVDGDAVNLCLNSWGSSNFPKQAEDVIPCLADFGFSKPLPAWFMEAVELLVENGSATFSTAQLASCFQLQYDRLSNCPSNFIAIGDSVMVLNPIFGQGCVKGMAGILTLDSMLRSEPSSASGRLSPSFSQRFFKKQAERTHHFWEANKAKDYAYSTTEPIPGETREYGRFLRWIDKVISQAVREDTEVGHALLCVRQMLAPETTFLQPSILLRILWAHVKQYCRTTSYRA